LQTEEEHLGSENGAIKEEVSEKLPSDDIEEILLETPKNENLDDTKQG